jgi:hypothetical protein
MLAINTYPQTYIDACRTRVEVQLADFQKLVAAKNRAGSKGPVFDKAFAAFESAFFNNLVIVLEGYFVHRTRGVEKKDGNPLNEVRVMAASMMLNGEVMMADSSVKMDPEKSVLKLSVGDKIALNEQSFTLLFKAFFEDLQTKYAEK